MLIIALISLSLYGISFLNGDVSTAATTDLSISNPKNIVSEGYFEKDKENNLNYHSKNNIYAANVNAVNN